MSSLLSIHDWLVSIFLLASIVCLVTLPRGPR